MTPFDVNALLAAGAAGALAPPEPPHIAEHPEGPSANSFAEAPVQHPDDSRTSAIARANHALGLATLILLVDRGVATEADVIAVVDQARAMLAMSAGALEDWRATDAVLRDGATALKIVLDEMRARSAGLVSGARH